MSTENDAVTIEELEKAGEIMDASDVSAINIANADRGDETIEELEARLPQSAIDLANETTANVVKSKAKERRRFNHRNRDAWERMNRPSKLKKIEDGMERMYNLIAGKGHHTDAEVKAGVATDA